VKLAQRLSPTPVTPSPRRAADHDWLINHAGCATVEPYARHASARSSSGSFPTTNLTAGTILRRRAGVGSQRDSDRSTRRRRLRLGLHRPTRVNLGPPRPCTWNASSRGAANHLGFHTLDRLSCAGGTPSLWPRPRLPADNTCATITFRTAWRTLGYRCQPVCGHASFPGDSRRRSGTDDRLISERAA